jgi:hypothetical protein
MHLLDGEVSMSRMIRLPWGSPNFHRRNLLIYVLSALSALLPSTSFAELKLGPYSFANAPAKQLEIRTSLVNGLRSHQFISNVGGVAFEGVAAPRGGQQFDEVQFSYDVGKPDGERLAVTFRRGRAERRLSAAAYDWQLFPIARFANSPSHACATSQGKLADERQYNQHVRRGNWVLNYHPAFEGTLLGLRLLQADFITVIPEACDLPKENGRYLLGNGESSPNAEANRREWDAFRRAVAAIKEDYTAFVVCDYESPVKFDATKDDRLALFGDPVWCYVRCTKEAAEQAETALDLEIANRRRELEGKNGNSHSGTTPLSHRRAEICRELLSIYTEPYVEQRKAQLVDELSSGNGVRFLEDFSAKMTALVKQHQDMNPLVYQSLRTTMQLAAFFRWANKISPGCLDGLISQSRRSDSLGSHSTPSILVVAEEP